MTRAAPSARPDTEVVFDPATYTGGVPFDALARLRRDRPVAWVPEIPVLGWPEGPGFWLVLRHADVESVLTRPGLFSSALGATQIRDPATPEALGYVRRMMLNMDPPEHSRLRRLLGRSFTPRAVARLEDKIRGHARAICDRALTGPRGECDFAKDLAADLPLLTLADVLGLPEQERWLLFDWSNRVIGYQDPDYAASAEFENMFWLFAVAGNETLRNGLPGACVALLEHPRAAAELRADPALLPVAVDEMLRWWTPVMTFRRTATADCELGGQAIRAGEKVVVSFTSANRDEAVFADPGRFDIRRHPNPHLVFGHGPHFCLGAHLARAQMRALFEEVLTRTSSLSYAGPPSYLRSNFQRGIKRLPVAWTARK